MTCKSKCVNKNLYGKKTGKSGKKTNMYKFSIRTYYSSLYN